MKVIRVCMGGHMNAKNSGDDILYHFFQKQLMANNPDFAKSFIVQAINALGIWIHPDLYQKLPVILPFVVRDPSCRKNKITGKDEWASPNDEGFLRDDNSLVKGIIKSMPVTPNNSLYVGKTLGNGFVTSHIWRRIKPGNNIDFASNSNATSIHFPLRSNVTRSLPLTPGNISQQNQPITFSSSASTPHTAVSPALFTVSGIRLPRSPSSTISVSTASITQRSKTVFSGRCCLLGWPSFPHHLLITGIPTALLIWFDHPHPLPLIVQGTGGSFIRW